MLSKVKNKYCVTKLLHTHSQEKVAHRDPTKPTIPCCHARAKSVLAVIEIPFSSHTQLSRDY